MGSIAMTNKTPRSEQICTECGKQGVLAKNLCGSCYNRQWQLKPKVKHPPTKKKTPSATLKLPEGCYIDNGIVWFNRECEYNYEDPKALTIQYKASVIQNSTIAAIVHERFPGIQKERILHWLSYYNQYYTFRKPGEYLERDKWYKDQEFKIISRKEVKSSNPFAIRDTSFATQNQPLLNKRSRKRIGSLNKLDKNLLYSVRNHKPNYNYNWFKRDEMDYYINR